MFWRSKSPKKDATTPQQNKKKIRKRDRDKPPEKRLEDWRNLVEERLNEAIERGDFENLPGAGKPLNLGKNPNEPNELRMAHGLLKNNELAPAWILDRRHLIEETEALRNEIARKWQWCQIKLGEDDEELKEAVVYQWARWLEAWETKIKDLNGRILNFNLSLPIWRMELLRLNLDRELKEFGAQRAITKE